MKPIIFCNITYMKYYKGVIPGVDEPQNGGSHVKETGDACEAYNFEPVYFEGKSAELCLGFVMMAQSKKNRYSQLHIEKIIGCQAARKESTAEGVTVVWCAKSDDFGGVRVVGWYENATVFRNFATCEFGNGYVQEFNFCANAEDCVLLPENERALEKWIVPRSGYNGYDFGFGRSNLWYAQGAKENPRLKDFLENIIEQIENYDGDNYIEKEAE